MLKVTVHVVSGCYETDDSPLQAECRSRVDSCVDFDIPESGIQERPDGHDAIYALGRFLKHKESIVKANPMSGPDLDLAFRTALSWMVSEDRENSKLPAVPRGTEVGLRYVRDRIK